MSVVCFYCGQEKRKPKLVVTLTSDGSRRVPIAGPNRKNSCFGKKYNITVVFVIATTHKRAGEWGRVSATTFKQGG